MSNANPTMEEIVQVVANINGSFSDVLYHRCTHLEPPTLLTIESDGYETLVKCLGDFIWSTEDDYRDYLFDEKTGEDILDEIGDKAKEDLEEYFIKMFKGIVEMVSFFKESLDDVDLTIEQELELHERGEREFERSC